MFFRVTTLKKHGKRYQYGHIAESYRRESDGRPAQRILASLGQVSDLEVENFRAAFAAMRQGQRVALVDDQLPLPEPTLSLEFLDCAVILALWKHWGLGDLLSQLLSDVSATVPAADVIAALVCQRCIAPGSKLSATRWVPRTALPELLGFSPEAMNNSRVHRVLDQLSEVEDGLQSALATRYRAEGAFVALYIDTTDAVFVGKGPPQAKRSQWKDGALKRRVVISLLCDQRGFPLRWDVLDGHSADNVTFVEAVSQLRARSWAQQVPIVMDRAAGASATIGQLLETECWFLTALRKTEFPTYAPNIPYEGLLDLDDEDDATLAVTAAEWIERNGFQRVSDTLLVHDLGVIEPQRTASEPPRRSGDLPRVDTEAARRCREALLSTRAATVAVSSGAVASYNAYCKAQGINPAVLKKYRKLEQLTPTLQDAVLNQQYQPESLAQLLAVAALPPDQQNARLGVVSSGPADRTPLPGERLPTVRAVLYFNPALFVLKRRNAQKKSRQFEAAIEKLNSGLAKRTQPLKNAQRTVERMLDRAGLTGAYDYRISTDERGRLHVGLTPRPEQSKRRRFDGFSLLVGNPDLKHTGEALCRLYRSRELIEYDFRTIKSFVDLNPVRHRVEEKVRAHVTICMLALLIERTLDAKLSEMTAPAALERLQTCRLNRFGERRYALTRPSEEQRTIIDALQLNHLLDPTEVTSSIHPR